MKGAAENYVKFLIGFVNERILLAIADVELRLDCAVDADCALRVLRSALSKDDEPLLASLVLIGLFDKKFSEVVAEGPLNCGERLENALKEILVGRPFFPELFQ